MGLIPFGTFPNLFNRGPKTQMDSFLFKDSLSSPSYFNHLPLSRVNVKME